MDFYSTIAKYYDDIFPLNEKTVNFLQKVFTNKIHLLDIACATGQYTNKLSQLGHVVEGIDLDQKMINIAKNQYPKINFKVENMENINDIKKYDGAFCIGNSLVHLQDLEKIKQVIKKISDSLNENGVLIIQIINYDRIINKKISCLPTITNDKINFIRNYDFKGKMINFISELKTTEGIFKSTTKLFPLLYNDLKEAFKQANFKKIESFNGFSDQPFDLDNTIQLVMVGYK